MSKEECKYKYVDSSDEGTQSYSCKLNKEGVDVDCKCDMNEESLLSTIKAHCEEKIKETKGCEDYWFNDCEIEHNLRIDIYQKILSMIEEGNKWN